MFTSASLSSRMQTGNGKGKGEKNKYFHHLNIPTFTGAEAMKIDWALLNHFLSAK